MKPRANTQTQVRALLWEEARVGGAIAGVCTLVGLLLLSVNYRVEGAWQRDEFTTYFGALGLPIITAFLLILNIDTSGHLVGGFSKRILRLPVQTTIAVAVSLMMRTAIMFATSSVLLLFAAFFYDDTPGITAVCLITLGYLVLQTLDWLRGPLRGLSSSVVLLAIASTSLWIWPDAPVFEPIRELFDAVTRTPAVLPTVLVFALVVGLAVNTFAVNADRIGRRYGPPEIWEWPGLLSPSRRRVINKRPFSSPMAAQVWFELRRTKFLMPLIALFTFAVLYVAVWFADANTSIAAQQVIRFYGLFFSVLMAAAVQGIQSRVIGFRRHSSMTGYEYLQPLTDAQFASARAIAAGILLIPTIVAALIFHFGVAGQMFITKIIPEALERGMTSPREIVWILISRGLFVGLFAWAAFAIGTRLFRRILAVLIAIYVVLALIGLTLKRYSMFYLIDFSWPNERDKVASLLVTLLLVAAVSSAIRLTRRGLLPARTLAKWTIAWLLLAWLFRSVLLSVWVPGPAPLNQQLLAILTALGTASLLPLVYFAILFDVNRRRSARSASVDPSQHAGAPFRLSAGLVAGAVLAAFVVWLGWPEAPAFLKYRRSHDYPATREELDAWYITPPADQNAAPKYLDVSSKLEFRQQVYNDRYSQVKRTMLVHGTRRERSISTITSDDYLYVIGTSAPMRTGLLDPRKWNLTEFYWGEVTSKIAPQLEEIAKQDTSISRYPMDLTKGYDTMMEHLDPLRALTRQARLDAMHWTLAGKPDRAVSSIVAGLAISRSLQQEPVIISQLVGFATIGVNMEAVEFLLNRSVPAEADLARLQRAVEGAVPPSSERLLFDRAMIGEGGIQASIVYLPIVNDTYMRVPNATPKVLLPLLAFPLASTQMVLTFEMDNTLRDARLPWAEFQRSSDARQTSEYWYALSFASPLVGMIMPAMTRAYESEWRNRTMLDNARVAIAVERYRLAHKKLPDTLDVLVPDFLTEVPDDYFAGPGVPLKYIVRDTGEYAVYSIGADQEDDYGIYNKKDGYRAGDIMLTVAPMSARTGKQVGTYYDVTESDQ